MKVLNLRCANGHGFEGWFASDEDFMSQNGRGQVECPLCADKVIARMPAAPRLNLSGARQHSADSETRSATAPAMPPRPADLQAAWLNTVRHLMSHTEDVGERFSEEARRIHYGEGKARGIRGQASAEQRAALDDEGIQTLSIPVPAALKGPVQ